MCYPGNVILICGSRTWCRAFRNIIREITHTNSRIENQIWWSKRALLYLTIFFIVNLKKKRSETSEYFNLWYSIETQVVVMATAIKANRICSKIARAFEIWYWCRSWNIRKSCRLNLCYSRQKLRNSCWRLGNTGHSRCHWCWSLCWFRRGINNLSKDI